MEPDSPKADAYRFGPFRLEPLERRLLRDEILVALTPKAFDVLLVLVENPGRLLEKDALMKRVWADAFVEEANLANNISLLRKILGEGSGGAEYIETVPKRGYRFLARVTKLNSSNGDQAVANAQIGEFVAGSRSVETVRPAAVAPKAILLGTLILAISVAIGVVAVTVHRSEAPAPTSHARFTVSAPSGTSLPPPFQPISPALSPDGRRLAFRVLRGGESVIAIRAIDGLDTQVLAGTEGGVFPFWSPDSHAIAFFAGGKLKKSSVSGGAMQTICDAPEGFGGTWNREGVILFAPRERDGLFTVHATGGQPTQVTWLQGNETFHQHPQFLPDGHRFIYFASPDGVYLGSLDGGAPVRILTSRSQARYSPPGLVLFVRDRTLVAQRFDVDRARLSGDPMPLAESVPVGGARADGLPAGGGAISVSENGVLAYRTVATMQWKLTWFDRTGQVVTLAGSLPFGNFSDFELSPNGKQIAVAHGSAPFAGDIWVFDLGTGQANQITFRSAGDRRPIWSPDGQWLAFASGRREAPGIYRKKITGETPEELLLPADTNRLAWPSDWASSGLVYETRQSGDILRLPLGGDRKSDVLARAPVSEPDAMLSPDEKWLAYSSSQLGRAERREVFVQSVLTPAKYRISINGGSRPRWRADGRELFYLAGDGTLMGVRVDGGPTSLRHGAPESLFGTGLSSMPEGLRSFAVTPNGQRFLIAVPKDPAAIQSLVVVSNWPAALKQ